MYARYGLWGEHQGGNTTEHSFTGKKRDAATGLTYCNARYFIPEIGRFINIDPAKDGRNWYVYCSNNPLKNIDLNGLADVYFLYTFVSNDKKDQRLLKSEINTINEEVQALADNGFDVVVDQAATRTDLVNAFQDPDAKLIYTSGHGYAGKQTAIQTADGRGFKPNDIDSSKVGKNLKTVIMANCFQGSQKNKGAWKQSLNSNTNVVGWKGTVTVGATKRFNNSGLLDKQPKTLLDYIKEIIEKTKPKSVSTIEVPDNEDN